MLGCAISAAAALMIGVAPDFSPGPRESIYRLYPAADVTVMTASALAIAIPYAFASSFITPRCPCNPSAIPKLHEATGSSVHVIPSPGGAQLAFTRVF